MAYAIITAFGAAGNGANSTIYTAQAKQTAIFGAITAYASTAGANLSLSIKEDDGSVSVLATQSVSAGTTVSFSGGSTGRITPLTMNSGNILYASASASDVRVRCSGLRFY